MEPFWWSWIKDNAPEEVKQRVMELCNELVEQKGQVEKIKGRDPHTYYLAEIAGRDAAVREKDKLKEELEQVKASKDLAYSERDKLVSFLSKVFPAVLERHPAEEEWEDDWRWIVFIETPAGQLSWHIHDSELPLFEHLEREVGVKWDGHTTEEKYTRLAAIVW